MTSRYSGYDRQGYKEKLFAQDSNSVYTGTKMHTTASPQNASPSTLRGAHAVAHAHIYTYSPHPGKPSRVVVYVMRRAGILGEGPAK